MERANDPELGLAELLSSLGEELRIANQRAADRGAATLAWADATVDVELAVSTNAKGGIRFLVLGIGAEGGADRGTTRALRAQVRCVPVPIGAAYTSDVGDGAGMVVGDNNSVRMTFPDEVQTDRGKEQNQ
jgi:hypothetical protein